ncbi:MAG: LysR family transcriptional regulator [Arenibacterium sp.]
MYGFHLEYRWDMDFDLRQLRYFVSIANSGSFSKAASELSVAQSALSHHISQMEGRLGVMLFARTSKGVTLTESGRRFLDHAHAILAAVEAATNDVRDDVREPGGLVRIGITLTVAPALVAPLMVRLNEHAPRVSLRVQEQLSPPLTQALVRGELDVAVCFNAGDEKSISGTALFEENLCLVGTSELIGPADQPVTLEDALSYPLLLPGRDHILRGMIDRVSLFRNHPIVLRHECMSLISLYSGLEHGLGATLVSKFSALQLWKAGKVVCRPITEPGVSRQLFVSVSAERTMTTAQKVVRDMATEIIREKVVEQEWPETRLV